jgi:hypothetical protein
MRKHPIRVQRFVVGKNNSIARRLDDGILTVPISAEHRVTGDKDMKLFIKNRQPSNPKLELTLNQLRNLLSCFCSDLI